MDPGPLFYGRIRVHFFTCGWKACGKKSYYSRPGRMADDAFCPSWATPSIEFAILPPTLRRGSPPALRHQRNP